MVRDFKNDKNIHVMKVFEGFSFVVWDFQNENKTKNKNKSIQTIVPRSAWKIKMYIHFFRQKKFGVDDETFGVSDGKLVSMLKIWCE